MSQGPPPSEAAPRSRWRSVLRYGGIVTVLLVGGIFIMRRELGDVLAGKLRERLSSEGIYVDWKSAGWNPGSGVKVRDLALYRDVEKRERLALLSEVTLVKGEPEWTRWDTVAAHAADASLTLGNGESEIILEHLTVMLQIQPGSVTLQECRTELYNLGIEAAGNYVRPAASTSESAPGDKAPKPTTRTRGVLSEVDLAPLRVVKEWMKLKPEKGKPVLKLEFHPAVSGGGVELVATLEGRDFVWRGQKWDFLEAAMKTVLGTGKPPVESGRLRVGLEGRTAEFDGQFDHASRTIRIGRLESGVGLLTLARAMVPKGSTVLTNVASTGAWQVSGEGEIPLEQPDKLRWNATLALEGELDFASHPFHVKMQKPACTFRVQEGEWSVSNFTAGVWGGQFRVPMMQVHPSQGKAKPRVDIQVVLQQAQLESFLGSFGALYTQPGTFHLDWKGGGEIDLASVAGTGTLSIEQAGLFSVPKQDRVALTGHMTLTKGKADDGDRKSPDDDDGLHVSLADAQLSLGSGDEETTMDDMTLRLFIKSGVTELQEFQARAHGFQIEAKGIHGKAVDADATSTKGTTSAKANAPATPAAKEGSRFVDWNLDGLKSLKAWTTFKPEGSAPVLKLQFQSLADRRGLGFDALLEAKKFQWRGQKWDTLRATMKTAAGKRKAPVQTCELRLVQAGDAVEMSGELDSTKGVMRIDKLESGLDYLVLVRTLAPKAMPSLQGLTTTGACRILGKGAIPLERPGDMRWDADVTIGGALIYTNGKFRAVMEKPTAALRVQGDDWYFTGLKGQLWGGELDVPDLQFHFPSGKKKSRFATQLVLKDARLESVLVGFGQPLQKQPGTVQFDWRGGGEFDLDAFAGAGQLTVEDAEFGRLPVFGTMGRLLDKLTPGFGRDISTRVKVEHRIGKGVVGLDDVELETQQMRIEGDGTIDLKRRYADFTGDLNLKGLVGLATRPLKSMTEITGTGPLTAVKWEDHRKGILRGRDDDDAE
ncbi:AsmA-like protein [Roseimicrobium gellanilyticum]|uniref:AsmA-like protein n=1 Tax=Roseimicrobium gellanilyticum TaxID=748857 RepID=A0A366HV77_9BACT|nr:AsmA-like C-terminal region-containing protein [Roseimicrobium gellanilyticum]RBP48176.1 AsmA-like protein [Roseimicrobium gellanilyticum]